MWEPGPLEDVGPKSSGYVAGNRPWPFNLEPAILLTLLYYGSNGNYIIKKPKEETI